MLRLPADHAERFILAEEVHARPSEALEAPVRASYLAVLVDPDARVSERNHLAALCERFGVAPPADNGTHVSAEMGGFRLKWERHGEFSSYTVFVAGLEQQPFGDPAATYLPPGWLAAIPGRTIVAAHAVFLNNAGDPPPVTQVAEHFGGHTVVGARVGDGAGFAYTDFRIHGDGCARFLILNKALSPGQAGRTMQRLFEIEAYRMMALLALPIARRQSPRVLAIERALAALTDDIARDAGGDEDLLRELTRLAAEVESGLSASQFRFGASRAYYELVTARIAELREQRLPSVQTIEEFMARRLKPAVATCATISQRMRDLSERVAQASGLLSTRVSIVREQQNQALLASMNRRAKVQLRLQQTVEGLSIAAILYYLVGLIGYAAKAANAAGLAVKPDVVTGISIPIIAVLLIIAVRRTRKRLFSPDEDDATVG
ncbi:MAG: DUF3422 family protein [Burkholderiaceae bacterium]